MCSTTLIAGHPGARRLGATAAALCRARQRAAGRGGGAGNGLPRGGGREGRHG